MESRPHNPRPRPHHSRPRPRPDHSRPRPPLPRLRPIKSETKTANISTRKISIFHWEYFSTRKTYLFHWGYWNLPPTECFFHASIFIFFFFRSCDLDRVVSSETFEPRDRDETFERWDRDKTESHKIRSRDLHHWYVHPISIILHVNNHTNEWHTFSSKL